MYNLVSIYYGDVIQVLVENDYLDNIPIIILYKIDNKSIIKDKCTKFMDTLINHKINIH